MKRTASGDGSRLWRLLIVVVLLAAWAAPGVAQNNAPEKRGTLERIKVHGAALEGNLEGNSPDRDVFIYLPPSYATSPNQRYPVVYLLHGYGLTAERWMTFTGLPGSADRLIAAGAIKEMIFVNPDAFTKHSGSMYSTSPTIGDWETYIAEDLVNYVDKNYRTIPTRESRGLAGHSMGGYGTLRIGMKRPDVFSSLYPMSACCLIDATITGGGRGGRGAAPAGRAGAAPAAPQAAPAANTNAAPAAPSTPAANPSPAAAPQAAGNQGDGRGRGAGQGAGRSGRGGGFGNVQFALAAAWAPNPNNPPNYFDLPTVEGTPQPLVIAKFAANSPFVMIPQYLTNLRKYKAIKLDVGDKDGLAGQNRQVEESLTAFGIAHTFETYDGDHSNRVPQRFETSVFPFFSSNLSFTAPKR